jgi:hypothetical protein
VGLRASHCLPGAERVGCIRFVEPALGSRLRIRGRAGYARAPCFCLRVSPVPGNGRGREHTRHPASRAPLRPRAYCATTRLESRCGSASSAALGP